MLCCYVVPAYYFFALGFIIKAFVIFIKLKNLLNKFVIKRF